LRIPAQPRRRQPRRRQQFEDRSNESRVTVEIIEFFFEAALRATKVEAMLSPRRTKFRKQHRGRMRGMAQRGNTINFGDYAIQSTEPCMD
jgi:hypothetical protein